LTAGLAHDSCRLVRAEPRVATILTFSTSTQSDPQGVTRRGDMRAEVIVFPRTDLSALRRLSETDTQVPHCNDRPTATPGDGDQA
jgi:hypothetical protein